MLTIILICVIIGAIIASQKPDRSIVRESVNVLWAFLAVIFVIVVAIVLVGCLPILMFI